MPSKANGTRVRKFGSTAMPLLANGAGVLAVFSSEGGT